MIEYTLLIFARLTSAGAGYVVLAYSANKLQPGVFAELTFYQSLQFLATVVVDAGMAQAATRRTAGATNWVDIAREYQSIRLLLHSIAALLTFAVASVHTSASDPMLAISCAVAVLSNLFNTDWLLIAAGLRKRWAQKALIVGVANVTCTVLLFLLLDAPSAVLFGQALATCAGAAFLRLHHLLPLAWPRLPNRAQLRDALALSSANIATHLAYGLPILAATSFAPPTIAGGFACLYRIFSASTLLVPITTDFVAARMIAERRNQSTGKVQSARSASFLLGSCLLATSPFVLLSSEMLVRLFSSAIDLGKYSLSGSDFLIYKLALLFYCFEFAAVRFAFVLSNNRALLTGTSGGLALSGIVTVWLLHGQPAAATTWFLPVLAYQLWTALLTAVLVLRGIRHTLSPSI